MPLRDHSHAPLSRHRGWDGLNGAWPTFIVMDLNKRLPLEYVAEPRIHLGTSFEVDVATSVRERDEPHSAEESSGRGGLATALWAPPRPTLTIATLMPEQDEYEVRVIETDSGRLVAAVEIVSPANKDRPESRRGVTAKCAALLQDGVSVSIVDIVTNRHANLYAELLDVFGQTDPLFMPAPPAIYAAVCRWRSEGGEGRLEAWAHPLAVGEPFPILPLRLTAELAMPLELEMTYEQTCQNLRIG